MANGYWLLVPECSRSERTEEWFVEVVPNPQTPNP